MIVKYKCQNCGNTITKLFKSSDKPKPFLECGVCGGVLEKELPNISMSSVEVVDNGAMVKKVELRRDAVERYKQRSVDFAKMMENRGRILKDEE